MVEATNAQREEFGLQRLCALVEAKAREPVDHVLAAVFAEVTAWTARQDDDVTALVMRYLPGPAV